MFRTYRQLPPIQTGYPLDDVWSVVVPIARTNLVTNPSFETGTTSWTASGGSIARTTTQQYHGAYSLAITPTAATTDGARYDTVSLTSGTTYAYSAKVRGVAG
jgi:arabinoxylan arabinofuranohydrolase